MAERFGELVVRQAEQSDVGAVAALRSLWSGGAEADAAFERRMADWLASERDHRTTWLALIGEFPVGMASMLEYRRMPRPEGPDSRWGYVGNVFVRADARGCGVGTSLLDELVSAARARGYVRLVLSPSRQAMSFFRRAGFVNSEQTASNLLLVRKLEP
ncbi:MAG: GNAT family N-acetyltransferase [Solirubrobacteraceae bacterium]